MTISRVLTENSSTSSFEDRVNTIPISRSIRQELTDIYSPSKRSEIMSKVRDRNSKAELAVRSLLHNLGYRFRLHRKDLPGKPDIVLPKYNSVIFVHGCFWHQHKNCARSRLPKTNKEFWRSKLNRNVERDIENETKLIADGWKVLCIWECETKKSNFSMLETNLRTFLEYDE